MTEPSTPLSGRGVRAAAGLGLLLLAASPARTLAAEATAPPAAARPTTAQMGSLHRVAAVLEATLDVHRLALLEVSAAARKLLEAGALKDATPGSPLPASAAEVLSRLATSVVARVPATALPAVPRAYEAEAVEALEDLGRATQLGQVLAPLRAYAGAIGRLLASADEIVDLYSRKRPVETRVVDPGFMMDDMNDALDELARSESGIGRVRERHRPMSEQLQAFLRLEVALGHTLDLIAEAQEAGVHIGFEAPVSTASLASIGRQTRTHLDELATVLTDMERPPAALAGGLEALVTGGPEGTPFEVKLAWQAPDPATAPPALRLYRQANKREAVAFLTSVLTCESGDARAALASAQEAQKDVDPQPALVSELAPGRASASETLDARARLYAPPRYRLVPVSAFGAEGRGVETLAVFLPRTAEPPPRVGATLAARDPSDPAFYRGADAVELEWDASRSESPSGERPDPAAAAWAREQKLPVLRGYRVVRHCGETAAVVAVLPAGARRFTDRPTPAQLAQGVSYTVEPETEPQAEAGSPAPCRLAAVRADVPAALALAAAGIALVSHPTAIERAAFVRLREGDALGEALTAFAALPADERQRLMEGWWRSLAPASRVALLQSWPDYVTRPTELAWLLEGVDHLSARDRAWVVPDVWLSVQPPFMQREVERWWGLLDEKSRHAALAGWQTTLDARHLKWIEERLKGGDQSVLRPARVLAWWGSRDAGERERLEDWWASLAPEERRKLYREWLADQPAAVKLSVRWPDWARRTDAERRTLLAEAWRELPDGLLVHLLAWLEWHSLQGAALDQAIAGEIGGWARLTSRARYGLRPLDRAMGFRLWTWSAAVALVAVVGLLFLNLRRRGRPQLR